MASSGLDPEALAFVRRVAGTDATAEEIAGDASTRRFFRVRSKSGVAGQTAGGYRHPTAILMVHGEPLPHDAPFFSNHRILVTCKAPVPEILGAEERLGLVLVQDFGDHTLQQYVLKNEMRPVLSRYWEAVGILNYMAKGYAAAISPGDFAARNALDRERFLFELGHFDRHFLRGLLGHTPTPAEERQLSGFYEELADACDRLPRLYCHRDYQSRNLMVREGGQLGLIDFQDARMGPYTYDMVSLLRDSSVHLPPKVIHESLSILNITIAGPLAVGREEFIRDFHLMALQRNIKDLGTFGYMATVRGRPEYLKYVPRTQRRIRWNMAYHQRWHDAFEPMSRLALIPPP